MKKGVFIIVLLFLSSLGIFGQEFKFEQSGPHGDVYFWNKARVDADGKAGGRAIVHGTGNRLCFNYNNDFTGGVDIGTYVKFRDAKELYQLELDGNQLVKGKIHVSFNNNESLRLGRIGDKGNLQVPKGSIASQYNIDFTGYRDQVQDQIGARISAIRYNNYSDNNALIQNTGLAFYTNPSGMLSGTEELLERMCITPTGNIGIGTSNPTSKLEVAGSLKAGNLKLDDMISIGESNNLRTFGQLAIHLENTPSSYGEIVFRFAEARYKSRIMSKIDNIGTNLSFVTSPKDSDNGSERMIIRGDGKIGIGTRNPSSLLDVNGTIRSKEVKIEATGWSDFVFDKDYKLPSLQYVEQHINEKQHLPDMPSEKQVLEEGVNVVEMQAKLLQKIEELTLYVIEQDKENKELKKQMNELKDENNYIKEQLLK